MKLSQIHLPVLEEGETSSCVCSSILHVFQPIVSVTALYLLSCFSPYTAVGNDSRISAHTLYCSCTLDKEREMQREGCLALTLTCGAAKGQG